MSTPSDMMRHALGVHDYGGRWKKPYRNHFVAGADHVAAWVSLVAQGMATLVHRGSEMSDGCPRFAVTDSGRAHALAGITFKRTWGYGKPVNP